MNGYETISPISFVLSMIITNEIQLGNAMHVYTFLSTMLARYDTLEKWNVASPHIYELAEHAGTSTQRLPYLDLRTRASAKREMKAWSRRVRELANQTPHAMKQAQTRYWAMHVPF